MTKTKIVSYNPFKPKFGDKFHLIVQNILSSLVPQASFPLQILWAYMGTPAQRRAEEFILSLDSRIRELELSHKLLLNDPLFQTMVITAVQIAVKTHLEEKLEALRNAVINSVRSTFEEDILLVYFRIIDGLSPYDIKVLQQFYTNGFYTMDETDFNSNLRYQSIQFLKANGLISEITFPKSKILPPTMQMDSPPMPSTNDFGRKFLDFIGISYKTANEVESK